MRGLTVRRLKKRFARTWLWRWLGGRASRLFDERLAEALQGCDTVADVGCGAQPHLMRQHAVRRRILVEAHWQSALVLRALDAFVLIADVAALPLAPKSVDGVLLLQVLEHLPREGGCANLKSIEGTARKVVVITTPNGFVEQDAVGGNPYQVHRSGWKPGDLEALGYNVNGYEAWKALKRPGTSVNRSPQFVTGQVGGMGFLSSLLWAFPSLAFQLLAVKRLRGA
jgi:hypothetical protein